MVVPGGTLIRSGLKSKSSTTAVSVDTGAAVTMGLGTGGAAVGPSDPFSANVHNVSPRGKLSWKLPPAATVTYCVSPIWYVIGGAFTPAPVWNCQRRLHVRVS